MIKQVEFNYQGAKKKNRSWKEIHNMKWLKFVTLTILSKIKNMINLTKLCILQMKKGMSQFVSLI